MFVPSPYTRAPPPWATATPVPAAVLHVTVKLPVVAFTTSHRCCVAGKMIWMFPVSVPARVMMGLAA
ncbi:hypothetical protein BAU08_05880 [Bordetella bronchialis]|uniref:Uncharacterized protein n=1 Tax=Bordetella bronchialis TaxID=463025 RepID=A0A193FV54_9BORD|nr:hypothetical protein BAU08_05880 [Bordetella bronchialis]